MRELHCEVCGDDLPFEAPPCADGHGADCPELACTGCGSAILLGSPLFDLDLDLGLDRPRRGHDRRRDSDHGSDHGSDYGSGHDRRDRRHGDDRPRPSARRRRRLAA